MKYTVTPAYGNIEAGRSPGSPPLLSVHPPPLHLLSAEFCVMYLDNIILGGSTEEIV